MNFRKTYDMWGGHFRSEKFPCAFSVKKKGGVAAPRKISLQKAQHSFPKIGWGVRGRLEVFRKFIEYGPDSSPLQERYRKLYISSQQDKHFLY